MNIGKMKINLKRTIRLTIAVFFFIILFLVGWNFITQSKKRPKVPLESEEISSQKVEKKEKIEHFEVKGERSNFEVRADKHYIGEDNKYHLEGNVEVVFFKKSEGEDIFLYAEEIIYNKKQNHFLLSSEARIKFKDIIIKSSFIHYDSRKEVFRSDKGVQFSSHALSGSAGKIMYSMKNEKVELRGNVFLEIRPHIETPFPLVVRGKKFDYIRKEKRGIMEGEVLISHGKSRARADFLEFELFTNEEQIKTVVLKGRVRASIIDNKKPTSQGKSSLIFSGVEREIKADEIKLRGFFDLPKIQAIEARGGCSFKFISSEGGYTLIQGESLEFILTKEGQLGEFKAVKNAKIVEQRKEPESMRIIEGQIMAMKDEAKILEVKGEKSLKPRILFKNSEIYADEMFIFVDSDDFELKGEVKAALKLQGGKKKSIGFFSQEKPVFISAQEMRYSEEQKRFLFKERIKMWQDKKSLTAEEALLDEETGKISTSGGVKTIIPNKPQNGEEKRIEINGQTMNFNHEKNFISYEGGCSLKVKDIALKAQSIFVYLKKGEVDMETIVAQGEVIIVQNLSEGRGQEARYDLKKDTIVLGGNPVLIDKNKGRIEGDKLTFYMADGRIVVENKDRERSVAVIKS